MLPATPTGGHQIPRTRPNAPASSHAARSEKYFNGTPTTSWITCIIFGSRRIFPTPENATIAANTIVMTRYAIFTGRSFTGQNHTAQCSTKTAPSGRPEDHWDRIMLRFTFQPSTVD